VNLPADTGANTRDGLRCFLAEDVVPHLPADLTFRRVCRTGNRWTVAEETMVGFTHDRVLPWLLPGFSPTHRHVEVLAVSMVTVRWSLITRYSTLWDLAALITQLNLDPAEVTSNPPASV